MGDSKMQLLRLKNFDNGYVNFELEKVIKEADIDVKAEEVLEEKGELVDQAEELDPSKFFHGLKEASKITQMLYNDQFKKKHPTNKVAIDRMESLRMKRETSPVNEREAEQSPSDSNPEFDVQDANPFKTFKRGVDDRMALYYRKKKPEKMEYIYDVSSKSNVMLDTIMKDIKYEPRVAKSLLFTEIIPEARKGDDPNADDKNEIESVPEEKKTDVIMKGLEQHIKHSEATKLVKDYNPKAYDFHQFRKNDYKELLIKIDRNKQKSTHSFLNALRATKDRLPNYKQVPQTYSIVEKTSNVAGKFMTSQIQSDPSPFVEIGDLAHRLVYMDKSMLTKDEIEVVSVKPMGREAGPVEALELCRILLGLQVTVQVFKDNRVENTILGKFMNSVSNHNLGWKQQLA